MPKNPPATTPTAAPKEEEKKMPPVTASPAKTPISETDGHARSVARMEAELKQLFSKYGQGFSNWWHNLTVPQREEMLLDMTVQTLPKTAPSPQEIKTGMKGGQSWRAASMDCNVKVMVGQCGCCNEAADVECPHYFPDRVLHELYIRAEKPETGYASDLATCVAMRREGIIPDRHSGQLAFVPPSRSEGPEKHDLKYVVVSEACPENKRKEWEDRISNGMVVDASVAYYLMERRQYTMMLLIVLFDEYQQRIRRVIPENPLERLRGCTYCHQSCEADTALRCNVCEVSWWCSPGCKNACNHGKQCPFGRPSSARVRFA